MQLIELDLVDGGAYDCVPQNLVVIESFDESKNETFPDAKTFVIHQNELGYGHLVTNTTLEEIGEAIRQSGPEDWFEITTKTGNRALIRRSSVSARRSLEEGSAITLMVGGTNQTLEVQEDVAQLRTLMNSVTLAEAPEGLQVIDPEPTPE